MATYVIGDIHGEFEQLQKLIKKINLQDSDDLYVIGDVIDRGPESVKVLQYLMSLPNCTCLAGNHEVMFLENMRILLNEITEDFLFQLSEDDLVQLLDWMNNGGGSTLKEFAKLSTEERREILEFVGDFESYVELNIEGQKYLLVHAGLGNFSEEKDITEYTLDELVWKRTDYEIPYFEDIIVVTGHTPTQNILGNPKPGYIYKANNHLAIDCCSFSERGRLAAVCLETGEEFYSR